MTTPIIFTCLFVVALTLVVQMVTSCSRRADFHAIAKQLRFIDAAAFRNLIDDSEKQFLRERLPQREFRIIHRERMLAAIEYVWADARNALITTRLAQAADEKEPSLAASTLSEAVNGLQIRMHALRVILRLCFSILFPQVTAFACLYAERHTTAQRQLVMPLTYHSPNVS